MNNLITTPLFVSMTSREIAELTGKQHAHVMRDIRTMIDELSVNPTLDFRCESETYIDSGGVPKKQYRLDKETTLTLISGYSAVIRFKVIKRWQELEGNQQSSSPYTAISIHTNRAVQVGNSKSINATLMEQGGRNAIVAYNLRNCTVQSGRLPTEWKEIAKAEGMPARQRGSAKDVLRIKEPQVACGMSLADCLVTGGASIDDGISIGKDSQFLFKRILALGITPPELLL